MTAKLVLETKWVNVSGFNMDIRQWFADNDINVKSVRWEEGDPRWADYIHILDTERPVDIIFESEEDATLFRLTWG